MDGVVDVYNVESPAYMSIMGSTSIWVVGWENEPLDMTCSHEPVHNRTARLLFFCLGDTSSFPQDVSSAADRISRSSCLPAAKFDSYDR